MAETPGSNWIPEGGLVDWTPYAVAVITAAALVTYTAVLVTKRWLRLNRKAAKHAHRRRADDARLRSQEIWRAVLSGRRAVQSDADDEDSSSSEGEEAGSGQGQGQGEGDDERAALLGRAEAGAGAECAALRPPLLTPLKLAEWLPASARATQHVAQLGVWLVVVSLVFEAFHMLAHTVGDAQPRAPVVLCVATLASVLAWAVVVALMTKETQTAILKPQRCRRTPRTRLKRALAAGAGWSSVVHGFWLFALLLAAVQAAALAHVGLSGAGLLGSPGLVATFAARGVGLVIINVCTILLLRFRLADRKLEAALDAAWAANVRLAEDEVARLLNPHESPAVPESERYKPPSTLADFVEKLAKLRPFVWPSGRDNRRLQMLICLCGVVLVCGRIVNLMVPLQYKVLIDELGGLGDSGSSKTTAIVDILSGNTTRVPWGALLVFVLLRFLQGGVGVLSSLQSYLWIPVGQFTTREISVQMFRHLHNLSLRFHLNRKTGEILRVQDRGVSSIVSLLSSLLFNIAPTLVDIAVACAYFTMQFDLAFGFIVFVTMGLYIYVTVALTEWRTKYRREANLLDNAMQAKAVDSLLNFETVKYYNAESYEVAQYTGAIREYQRADWQSSVSLSVLNTAQNVIISGGLLAGCLLCASRIVRDAADGSPRMTVGDFVLYLSYITQLYGPLNWFGTYYRVIQKNFVDMEKMLDLFQEPVEVLDAPQARPLSVSRGEVVFDRVSFAYDPRRPILHDVSFTIAPGATVALVGPSGSGKSSMLRLLFRFYDVQGGRVLIDGQEIRSVTQASLRRAIGVVPQDTVLFNETIRYNIRYGRPDATDTEVEAAARAAQIHDRILTFPDGYDTKVGERGLRLSGGEKQRVAIARTLLKNPAIVLLDEATSALDTHTERHIQSALHQMTRNRTTLVIAHRLSTVVHADLILVLRDGRIIERGSHPELMQRPDGAYRDMWLKQLRDDSVEAADEPVKAELVKGELVKGELAKGELVKDELVKDEPEAPEASPAPAASKPTQRSSGNRKARRR